MSTLRLQDGPIVYPSVDNQESSAVIVEMRPFDFGYPDKDKYLDSIVLQIRHEKLFINAELQYAAKDRLKELEPGKFNWRRYGSIRTPDKPLFRRVTARYFVFRLVDFAPQERWKFYGIQFFGEVLGTRL
jgi:hypothetical protein